MNENMIAICLYICILLMAGAVLVLTIMYFVKPGSTKPSSAPECEPGKDTAISKTEVKKINLDETDNSSIKIEEPKRKDEEIIPIVEATKTENKDKDILPAIENQKPVNKEVTEVIAPAEVRPAENGKNFTIVVAVKPEKELDTNAVPQPVGSKNGKKDTSLPEEIPMIKPVAAPNVKKSKSEVVKPQPENDNQTPIENKENEKAVKAETVKKEPESKMDTKNGKSPANATLEKPKTTTETAKPTASAQNSIVGKKGSDQKTSLDDLSKMFSKEVTDDTEATKLAKEMKDVEINRLIKDGQDIINLLKGNRS